jgi:hypothetical protein
MAKKKQIETKNTDGNKCPFCAKRKELTMELSEDAHKSADKRGKEKYAEIREGIRTAGFDINTMKSTGGGYRERIDECCEKISGSISDFYLDDKGNACHHHMCDTCGKRYPENGSYEGDYVNDDLREQ